MCGVGRVRPYTLIWINRARSRKSRTREEAIVTKTVILGGARIPFGRLNGSLASKTSVERGGIAIGSAMDRSGVSRADVEHVIMGQVLQGGVGQIPARQAAC